MSKQRILAMEYIRGLSMLGVIGIHTGAYSLSNPYVNIHLFALLEIFTRFSVPIFFFVSAFGLFLSQKLDTEFDYTDFMKRRLRTVLIPYLTWSVLYMIHYTLISGDRVIWKLPLLTEYFLFGLASYQLYFLVILLWFYALMPLWRMIVRKISAQPVNYLFIFLILQIMFNYYSSYILQPSSSNFYINLAIQYRLSYWVFHYVFIFLLGAVCAVKYKEFEEFISKNDRLVTFVFGITLTGILLYYYYLLFAKAYSPEAAVNTAHQLSPIGVLYTLGATLYWFKIFNQPSLSAKLQRLLKEFGNHSYMVYLVHPLVMYYLVTYLNAHSILMTAPVTIGFFLTATGISLIISVITARISIYFPLLNTILLGSKAVKEKSKA